MLRPGSLAVLVDARRHHSPDFQGLTILGSDVRKGWIRSLELRAAAALVKPLYRELTIDHSDNDVHVLGLQSSVHDKDGVVVDAGVDHGMTAGTDQESRLRVGDEDLAKVYGLLLQVFCRRGKASLGAAQLGKDEGCVMEQGW